MAEADAGAKERLGFLREDFGDQSSAIRKRGLGGLCLVGRGDAGLQSIEQRLELQVANAFN